MTTSEIIGVLKEARKYSINYVDTQIAQINEFIQMTKAKEIVQKHEARYKMNIPCGRNSFYQAYRKFFFLLDKTRN